MPAVVTTTPPSPPPPPPPSQPAATTAAPAAPSAPTTPTAAAAGNGNLRRRVAAAAPAPTAAEGPEPEAEPPGLEPKRPGKPRAWQTAWHPEPATCFNALIHPLRLMALRGVVWDQGEQDVHHAAEDYACLLPEFIKGWRRAFPYANALGPMPVGVFQLQGCVSKHAS